MPGYVRVERPCCARPFLLKAAPKRGQETYRRWCDHCRGTWYIVLTQIEPGRGIVHWRPTTYPRTKFAREDRVEVV